MLLLSDYRIWWSQAPHPQAAGIHGELHLPPPPGQQQHHHHQSGGRGVLLPLQDLIRLVLLPR